MYPATPPISNLPRPRLRQLAAWIRDELDLLVAREGPDILRPDDVLTLHEAFVALRHADGITALDLRATGIHRAVQDIAGIATRWPSRLCDDCDKIITIWTMRFGSLRNLHPFLYGRGGRLEGIASKYEYSRESLLKRWTLTCPNKIHPRRSHRRGSLGFRAGAWWINPLFAYHAGIIGLESLEGGTSYDKHGAYALLLKDTGEIEASSMERFTYRCLKSDKGKFRLTSALVQSREPIRVLRSHSINSVWGPKAGVRYEGLYKIDGWSIRSAKGIDIVSGEWKEGDIIYDIKFERADVVEIQDVIRHPTAAEVDDYSEYKRIRKATRDGKRKEITILAAEIDAEPASIIPPPLPPTTAPKTAHSKVTHSPSFRKSMFKSPHFDKAAEVLSTPGVDVVSPMTVPGVDHFNFTTSKRSTLAVPAQPSAQLPHKESDSSASDLGASISLVASNPGSGKTAGTQPDIREVAPWIDYDIGLNKPPPDQQITIVREKIISQNPVAVASAGETGTAANATQTMKQFGGRTNLPGDPHNPKLSTDIRDTRPPLSPSSVRARHESRKSLLARNHNPVAKLFDGTKDIARDIEPDDYFGDAVAPRAASLDNPLTTPYEDEDERQRQRASSTASDRTTLIHSHLPIRHFRPTSPMTPLSMARRDGICPPTDSAALFPVLPKGFHTGTVTTALPTTSSGASEPWIESPTLPWRVAASLPVSLKRLMKQPDTARMVGSSQPVEDGDAEEKGEEGGDEVVWSPGLRKMVGQMKPLSVRVSFHDPFAEEGMASEEKKGGRKRESSEVAPDEVA